MPTKHPHRKAPLERCIGIRRVCRPRERRERYEEGPSVVSERIRDIDTRCGRRLLVAPKHRLQTRGRQGDEVRRPSG